MTFKANGALFVETEEKLRARMGDRFDPTKNYPAYGGVINVPADQVDALVSYLKRATPDDRDTIPMKISGWKKEPQGGGRAYVSMAIEPDYKTMKAIEEAAPAADTAAASLAQATSGEVLTLQADVF